MPRLYCPVPLATGAALDLPSAAARHVQVLRMQPGEKLTLFDGQGGEYQAVIERMGRSDVGVVVGRHDPVEREVSRAIHLVVGMPANERMDWLVEKATELGAASIQPVLAQRSVLKLQGERAQKKQAHWQGIAIAACEQCGRNRVPLLHPVLGFAAWVATLASATPVTTTTPANGLETPPTKLLLSLAPAGEGLAVGMAGPAVSGFILLSGPEGGLTPQEEALAIEAGFRRASLGPRVLRSETAPLAALAALTLPQ